MKSLCTTLPWRQSVLSLASLKLSLVSRSLKANYLWAWFRFWSPWTVRSLYQSSKHQVIIMLCFLNQSCNHRTLFSACLPVPRSCSPPRLRPAPGAVEHQVAPMWVTWSSVHNCGAAWRVELWHGVTTRPYGPHSSGVEPGAW